MLYGALAKEHKKHTNKQFYGGHYYLIVTGIIFGIMLPNCNCSFHSPIITNALPIDSYTSDNLATSQVCV